MLVHKDLSGELTVFRRPFIAVRESNNRPHPISNFCENFHEITLTLLMFAECRCDSFQSNLLSDGLLV